MIGHFMSFFFDGRRCCKYPDRSCLCRKLERCVMTRVKCLSSLGSLLSRLAGVPPGVAVSRRSLACASWVCRSRPPSLPMAAGRDGGAAPHVEPLDDVRSSSCPE